jgi:hypothetical protein
MADRIMFCQSLRYFIRLFGNWAFATPLLPKGNVEFLAWMDQPQAENGSDSIRQMVERVIE